MNKYRNLAVVNGMLLAFMIFLNGILSKELGPYLSTFIYHILGFLLILLVSVIKNNTLPSLSKIPLIFFIPGMLNVLVIFLNNIALPKIGVTLTAGVGLFGQLVMSILIDHFGLFAMSINKIRKEKILSFLIIAAGVICMITL